MIGLTLAAIGVVVPGFHHSVCRMSVHTDESGGRTESSGCDETFPGELVPLAGLVGLVGVVVSLYAAFRMTRSDARTASRVILGLASLALLVPTLPVLATWTYVGFDLSIREGNGCSGGTFHDVPLWIQHTTCVSVADLFMTPMTALAGAFAAFAAWRPRPWPVVASIAAASATLAVFVVGFARDEIDLAPQWTVPLAGAVLLAGALGLLARPHAAQST